MTHWSSSCDTWGRHMNNPSGQLSQQYMAALRNYLADKNERALHQAYELGRRTIADGLGVIDMAKIHEDVLLAILPTAASTKESVRVAKIAGAFLAESLSPFEMTHRGFQSANQNLRELNETLEERNHQLAVANGKLKQEIAVRKQAEKELRESEDHYRVLLTQARLMQENLRYLSCQILNVQEEERKRISRELHDEVGQALTAVNVNLAMLKKAVRGKSSQLRRKIKDAQMLLEQTMESVHSFSRELRPAMLDDLGLIPALRSFAKSFAERTGVRVDFSATATVEQMEMDQKTVFYRVAQEALTNIAKHAQASHGQVVLRKFKGGIQMEINDDGRSFRVERQLSPEQKGKKRLGLLGIQERVRLANGIFNVESLPGKGTRIRVWIPFRIGNVTEGE
jgi:signal transduction histidine kinase